jgi:MerR family transcriptional regulator, redox-sensitive transcriptional activator SoxR
MRAVPGQITITELARRSGVAASALRYYESLGLIASERTEGNHRRYPRAMLRRVAVIQVAQGLGLSLNQVAAALAALPDGRGPTPRDWKRMSSRWQSELNTRIATLERLRDNLSSCIGCGCLSLETCALLNNEDRAAARGAGPRYLLGDTPDPAGKGS